MGCVYSGRSDVEATVEVLLSEVLHTAAGVIGGIDSGSSIGAFIALKEEVNKFKGLTINNLGAEEKSKMDLFFPRECLLRFIFSWRRACQFFSQFPPGIPTDH